MNNVLILGAGYVGTALSHALTNSNIKCHLRARKDLNYTDEADLDRYIRNNNINYVVNSFGFTGRPNVDEGEAKKKECWELNVASPLRVSNVCKRLNVNYIHISSGCIFSGYEKAFSEKDEPNFGLFDKSSFYSKTKHAFETLNDYGCTIRVRMPFSDTLSERSYLTKILKYNNLIDFKNSKTYVNDLCNFIHYIVINSIKASSIGIINFVNPGALNTSDVTEILTAYNFTNKNWKFVDVKTLNLAAPRSNCVLSMDKFKNMFPDFYIQTEREALAKALASC